MRYVCMGLMVLGGLLTGCGGVSEIKPDQTKKGPLKVDEQAMTKAMQDSMSKMSPEMQAKMKAMGGMSPEAMKAKAAEAAKQGAPAGS